MENTGNSCEQWLEEYAKEKGLTDYTSRVNPDALQTTLFGTEAFTSALMSKG